MKAIIILSVGWHEHLLHERMRSNPCSSILTRTVKPTHLHSESGSSSSTESSLSLYASSYLPVQDKQTGLRPSTSLKQLTSGSVKRSETPSAPDKFYKPFALCPDLDQPAPFPQRSRSPSQTTPLGPISTLRMRFYFKKMFS